MLCKLACVNCKCDCTCGELEPIYIETRPAPQRHKNAALRPINVLLYSRSRRYGFCREVLSRTCFNNAKLTNEEKK